MTSSKTAKVVDSFKSNLAATKNFNFEIEYGMSFSILKVESTH